MGPMESDSVMLARIKIHKHFKGKNYCKGSDKSIVVPLDEVVKYNDQNKDLS